MHINDLIFTWERIASDYPQCQSSQLFHHEREAQRVWVRSFLLCSLHAGPHFTFVKILTLTCTTIDKATTDETTEPPTQNDLSRILQAKLFKHPLNKGHGQKFNLDMLYHVLCPTWRNRTDWPSPLHTGPCKPEGKKGWPKQRYLIWAPPKSRNIIRGGVKKSWIFYSQADCKGRGVSPLGPDRQQMWKFWPAIKGSTVILDEKMCIGAQKSRKVDRKGRGSTLTVSLTVKYSFFTPPLRGWHLYLPITSSPLSTWQKTSLLGRGGGARQPVRLSCLHCLWNVFRAWIFFENLSLLWDDIMS